MGFSYRVGKGVRVRVSSRGVRTSIGPRSARLHVGAGRTGVSTGAGPVTYYTSVGGRGGRSAGSQTVGASQRQLAQAQKAEEAEVLAAAVQHILNLHRQAFPAAEVPVAPSPVPLDEEAIRKRHEAAALDGIGLFNRGERRHARQRAAAAADEEIGGKKDRQEHERREAQRQLEATWKLLLANEPQWYWLPSRRPSRTTKPERRPSTSTETRSSLSCCPRLLRSCPNGCRRPRRREI
jgi:hypothetical protein